MVPLIISILIWSYYCPRVIYWKILTKFMISSMCHCRSRTTRKKRVYKNVTRVLCQRTSAGHSTRSRLFCFMASLLQLQLHHFIDWLIRLLRHRVREVIEAYQYRLSVSGLGLCYKKLSDGVKYLVRKFTRLSRKERPAGVTRSYVNLSRPTAAGVKKSYVNLSEAYGGRRNKQLREPVKAQ